MPSIRLHYRRGLGRKGIDLLVEHGGRSEEFVVLDLSETGMRVRGRRPLPLGDRLPLLLRIKNEEIRAIGELVWCDERDVLYDDYTMGIQFFVHDETGHGHLERYLATY